MTVVTGEGATPIRAVLWDVDGTLADSEPTHERSFREASEALGARLPADFHGRILGRTDRESYGWLVESCGLTASYALWLERRFAAYLARVDAVEPIPESLALWRRFEAMGLAQATVSNSDRMILTANLARLGLTRPAMITVSRNDVVEGKPAPEPYLRGAMLLGCDPAEVVVIEDSATGMAAGLAAGMRVFMTPAYEGPQTGSWRPLAELAAWAARAPVG